MGVSMGVYLQSLIDGLLIGGVYATIAVGLSLAFGVMRIINWAYGELLMISMYVSYVIFSSLGLDPYVIAVITAVIMFGVGYLLQNTIISNILARETAREPVSVLLFTAGLGMFLSNGVLAIVGSAPVSVITKYSGKMLVINDIFISVPKLISFVIALLCTLLLYLFLQKSEMGRAIRATAQNRQVATLMGINQKKIYNIAFGISIALVGVSGALLLPYYTVSYSIGTTFSFKSFIIVVLGGKGSVLGALLGGLIVGVIEKIGGQMFSDTYAQMAVFVVFVLVLLFKPNGLLGEKEM